MNWHQPIDLYCERMEAGFWAEPVNALTNLAFLAAAWWGWRAWRAAGSHDMAALGLTALVALIGVGSFLFHTFATRWALMADVVPIQLFMLGMFALMLRRMLGWSAWWIGLGCVGFLAAGVLLPMLMRAVVGPAGTGGAVAGYGIGLVAMIWLGRAGAISAGNDRRAAGWLILVAAGVFAVSLAFRTLDPLICAAFPLGTHFLWHLMNALTLALLLDATLRVSADPSAGLARAAR